MVLICVCVCLSWDDDDDDDDDDDGDDDDDDDDPCLMIQKTRWGTSLPDLSLTTCNVTFGGSKSWVLQWSSSRPPGVWFRHTWNRRHGRRCSHSCWKENLEILGMKISHKTPLHGWRTVYLLIHEWLIFIGFHVGNIYQATHGWCGYWLNQRWYCYTSVHPPENLTAGAGSPENGGENQKEEEISNLGFPSFSGSSR